MQLKTPKIVLSPEDKCRCFTLSLDVDVKELTSNQEEANTRLILHAYHVLVKDNLNSVTIRSPSGDTDIVILTFALLFGLKEKVFLDNGRSDSRRLIPMDVVDLPDQHREALIGYHAFTGNDYVSSFSKKGKKTCWNKSTKKTKFSKGFTDLGNSTELSNEVSKF